MSKVSELITKYTKVIRSYDRDENVLFWFLEDLTSLSKTALLTSDEVLVDEKHLERMVDLYCNGMSAQYILGYAYFYGRKFNVNSSVLIPRNETEEVVDVAIKLIKEDNLSKVCDIGCGSGVIAITVGCECDISVDAVDISSEALAVAKVNAKNLDANVCFYQGDMLNPVIDHDYEMIISNPPYIPTDGFVDSETFANEPHLALFGGSDGLDFYRKIINDSRAFSSLKYIVFEIGFDQGSQLQELCEYRVEIKKDINGNDRIAIIYLKEE